MIDIDLSILGAPAAVFDTFERQIRAEYAHVPDALYAAGRGQVLSRFLAREALYTTAWLRDQLEDPARENLSRTLNALRAFGAKPAR